MKPVFRRVAGLCAVGVVLLAAGVGSQVPISPAEPGVHTSALVGEVVSPDGAPVPGVEVQIVGQGAKQSTITDAFGRFRFTNIQLGEYDVLATLEGFATVATEIQLTGGAAQTVQLMLGGPISPAEPGDGDENGGQGGGGSEEPGDGDENGGQGDGGSEEPGDGDENGGQGDGGSEEPRLPSTNSSTLVVTENQFNDDLALQEAFNRERSNGHELQAVIPLERGTSLFVYERRSNPAQCTVLVDVGGALAADRLETRIRQQPNKTFVGVHLLPSGASALVFRDDR